MLLDKISQTQEKSRTADETQRMQSSGIGVKEVKYNFVVSPQGLQSDLTMKYHSLETNFCREILFFGST